MRKKAHLNPDQQADKLKADKQADLHRKVWALSLPMLLSNLSVPLLGLVDTAVMGHLDSARYLAAVSVGAMILHFIFWGFGFLRMSTVGLSAQAFGAGDGMLLRSLLARAAVFALAIAVLLLVLQSVLISVALWLVSPAEELHALTASYFSIRIWSAPATLLGYVAMGWLMAIQKPKQVLLLTVLMNLVNIALDIWFVIGFGWGVEGVALASVFAEYSGLALAFVLVAHALKMFSGKFDSDAIFQWQAFRQLARTNSDIFIRTIALLFVFAFFTTQSARAGDTVMAANAILLQFVTFMAYVLDAYAHAAEAMVGAALGNRNNNEFKRSVIACRHWSLWSALVFCLAYLLFGQQIVNLLTDIDSVREYAYRYLGWLAIVPLIGVWSYLYDGVFIGATWSREMRDVMLTALFVFFLPAWWLSLQWQNHGLWFALLFFLLGRGGLMHWKYLQKMRQPV